MMTQTKVPHSELSQLNVSDSMGIFSNSLFVKSNLVNFCLLLKSRLYNCERNLLLRILFFLNLLSLLSDVNDKFTCDFAEHGYPSLSRVRISGN